LGKHFGVGEEDWSHRPFNNYADKAMMVHFPNGLIGEVQVMDQAMADAKDVAHKLYEEQRAAEVKGDTAKVKNAQQVEI
jgi:hypothetical protein